VNALSSLASSSASIQYAPLPTAEADRAFRYASSLEKAGLTRTAHAAYHEAATLYQCFLDSTDFDHVTDVDQTSDVKRFMLYSCMKLAFFSNDALSDPKAALRLYREAASMEVQSAEAFDGIGTSIEACVGNLEEAVAAYRVAFDLRNESDSPSGTIAFHLGVALERLGMEEEAEVLMDRLRRSEASYACLVDSWGYVRWHTRRKDSKQLNLYMGTRNMLQLGIESAMDLVKEADGLVCEFGVASGRSTRMLQELLPLDCMLNGFDTFTGLPLPWQDLPAGSFSTDGAIPNIEGEVKFYSGLFRDTIPEFLRKIEKTETEEKFRPLAFANIDVLMYGSTLDILESMHSRVVPGTIITFGDYMCHSSWRQDEFRAWRECCKRFGWSYEYIGFSLATKQVIVRVTSA